MSHQTDPLDTLLQAAAVRRLFGGVSAMWLWRRQKDGTLPPPMIIAGRRFWTVQQMSAVIEKIKRPPPSKQPEDHTPDISRRRGSTRRRNARVQRPTAESDAV